ncbi:YfiM family protein [Chitinophagales bacterium]|nr:YfiM family protein [Chitinophagales bacterium]
MLAQEHKEAFLEPAARIHKGRLIGLSASGLLLYAGITYSLSTTWYSEFEQGPFHFYNDNGEWLQMDKAGHFWTTYTEARIGMAMYEWTGLERRKAMWVGIGLAMTAQTTIEVLDGFSEKWGASLGDIAANTSGVGLLASQEYLWQEQRILLKFSAHLVDYDSQPSVVTQRVASLYGTSSSEQLLKDYNGQTYWLSFNPWTLAGRSSPVPGFLALSVGYGADGLLGGFENEWETEGQPHDFRSIPRKRQYYLSIDIDLTKIPTKSRFLKTLFVGLNSIKIPAPSISLASDGDMNWHWLYF